MAVLLCTVIGRVAWNHGYAGGYTTWTRPPAAIMELAFKAAKSSSSYLTIFPNNGNLWKSFWGNDVFINLPTGLGKSFIFRCLPFCRGYCSFKTKTCIRDKCLKCKSCGAVNANRTFKAAKKINIPLTPNNMSVNLLHLIMPLQVIPWSPSCLFCVSGVHR